jgi:hypothetical protein
MKRLLFLIAGMFAFGIAAHAQEVVSAWWPHQVGDSWTYEHEERDGANGGMAHPQVGRWREEQTIVGSSAIPEGMLIREQIRAVEPVPLEVRQRMPGIQSVRESFDLVHGNCVYEVRSPAEAPDWRNTPPDFCFPLTKDATWGRLPNTSPAEEFVWRVIGVDADRFGLTGATTFHFTAHAGSGEQVNRWFEQGIGLLQEIWEHHGTYEESRLQLLKAVIRGRTFAFQLNPARTMPLSDADCEGSGWQHFVRLDGTTFASQRACEVYSTPGH